ncbi:MAG: hypothetical protein VXW91_09520 [Pseudomonadota bacterium]|nr:hypothetical protein [Pseudomonadota bacterium]
MLVSIRKQSLFMGAAMTAGMMLGATEAKANNFGNIAENIILSIQDVPGLLTGLAYLFGILIGVLGIMKIKDHVENPAQTPLKDGAIRLAAGGALFALPIVFESMRTTVENAGGAAAVSAASLETVNFAVG